MGKTVEESKNEILNNLNTVNTDINTSETNKTSVGEKDTSKNEIATKTDVETNSNKSKENKEVLTFIKPVEGEIVKQYAKDNLLYSETLEEWTTHLGVDIKADKTTVVKASADGKVKSIKNDPRYGLVVAIEHQDGYVTLYSNLLTSEFVEVGETVKQGASIGTVGNTAVFEILDEPHLHFEILKDGENLDPSGFIK